MWIKFKHVLMWEPSDHPLCSVDWSPFRRTVFSGTTQDGDIHFYDLAVSHGIPVATIHATESAHKDALIGRFNHRRPEFYASGDGEGHVKIWRLSTLLMRGVDGANLYDEQILEKLGLA
ncbi:hypothetical protein BSLG_002429 [Batrachochytrium salamandrivorans]|nr:hypothetical protein BSLG_002429 [Batrachochytrium salamandrivorans]